jgi:hypothetical protein
MKQTAVEWLIEEIILRLGIRIENTFDGNNLLKQAKEMEKKQIMDAHIDGMDSLPVYPNYNEDAENYYNETYKKEEK